jgi:hypothetical protein
MVQRLLARADTLRLSLVRALLNPDLDSVDATSAAMNQRGSGEAPSRTRASRHRGASSSWRLLDGDSLRRSSRGDCIVCIERVEAGLAEAPEPRLASNTGEDRYPFLL